MNVLIDTNIVLDVLLHRQPFFANASQALFLSENKAIDGYISASAITDIYYLTQKACKDKAETLDLLNRLLKVVHIALVSSFEISRALVIGWDDFEDAVQYAVGESIAADYIATRNPQDFSSSVIPVIEPEPFLKLFVMTDDLTAAAAGGTMSSAFRCILQSVGVW
jgi:predicted nucleic acid-binding protein